MDCFSLIKFVSISGQPSVKIVKLCSKASVSKAYSVAIVNIMRVKSVSMVRILATIAPETFQWRNICMSVSKMKKSEAF